MSCLKRLKFYRQADHTLIITFKKKKITTSYHISDCSILLLLNKAVVLEIRSKPSYSCFSHNSTFNQTFKFVVLSNFSPEKFNELESIWISKLRTSEPDGLNRVDPFTLRTSVT